MKTQLKAPSVGESITEVRVSKWKKQSGELVKAGDVLVEIESDKATVEVVADTTGVLNIKVPEGTMVKIGEVLGEIDSEAKPTIESQTLKTTSNNENLSQKSTEMSHVSMQGASMSGVASQSGAQAFSSASSSVSSNAQNQLIAPSARRIAQENGVDTSKIQGTGKRGLITKGDVLEHLSKNTVFKTPNYQNPQEKRVPMSLLRQKIAERLVMAQHTAAILTTFNECDMSKVMALRAQYKEEFKAKYGVNLGFMSFFTRAVIEALKEIPALNAFIDGKDIVYHENFDIGIAVGTDRGLVVPVIRNAEKMSFAEIELKISEFAQKAKNNKLTVQDLTGGTFTISNGGTYGSLMSTPILNPPQSGILGMHKIMDRPVVVETASNEKQIVIRPMMYLALSYDHRIVDGKEAVTFLVRVKEGIENPVEKLGFKI
jgi:2-oxoglutarate dehydrogenase E2 component (dihydrolipoamide succinyltransferase)